MFDAVRNSKRFVQIFLALIILPFAFWGLDSFVSGNGVGANLASVGETKISSREFLEAMSEQQDQLRERLGDAFDSSILDSPAGRASMLDRLIEQRLLLIEAQNLGFAVTDDVLRDFIMSVPAFQEEGKFSKTRYEGFLQYRGLSQAGFDAELRQDMVVRQIAGAIGDTSVLSKTSTDLILSSMAEKRTVQEVILSPGDFFDEVKLTDEDVKTYYDGHLSEFQEPEQVRAEYVVLSYEAIESQIAVTDAEVKDWYEGHKDRYVQAEERRASHILITAEGDDADARLKAKARAEELLKQVRAKPADFGKLAKLNSKDPGSASSEGDLGFFGRGMMDDAFDDVVFSLKENDISDVVETDFGYHIIKLTGIHSAEGKSIDEVRGEIEAEIRQQGAQRKYAEAAEMFSNMVYEQSDSLNPVVEVFKLPIQTSEWLVKGAPVLPGAKAPMANPKVLAALFSDDAVKMKRNIEALEVGENTLVSARVLEHKPVSQKPFDTVKDSLKARLKNKEASDLAAKAGEARLLDLKAGKDVKLVWSAAQNVGRTDPGTLPLDAIKTVFGVSAANLPAYTGLSLPGGGYGLYKVVAVDKTGALEAEVATAISRELAEIVEREDMSAYLAGLRQRYKVEINMAALDDAR